MSPCFPVALFFFFFPAPARSAGAESDIRNLSSVFCLLNLGPKALGAVANSKLHLARHHHRTRMYVQIAMHAHHSFSASCEIFTILRSSPRNKLRRAWPGLPDADSNFAGPVKFQCSRIINQRPAHRPQGRGDEGRPRGRGVP